MSNSVNSVTFIQFLQENVGLVWSFVITGVGVAFVWVAKTALEIYKSFRYLDRQVQYEVSRDLLKSRISSFEALWHRLESLALYSEKAFSNSDAESLRSELSDWYFSPKGGLYLTSRTRDFYFALQETLTLLSVLPEWDCPVRPIHPKQVFEELLQTSQVGSGFDLGEPTRIDHTRWVEFCKHGLPGLLEMDSKKGGELFFSAAQQVSSVLRSNMAAELDSRVEVALPVEVP